MQRAHLLLQGAQRLGNKNRHGTMVP